MQLKLTSHLDTKTNHCWWRNMIDQNVKICFYMNLHIEIMRFLRDRLKSRWGQARFWKYVLKVEKGSWTSRQVFLISDLEQWVWRSKMAALCSQAFWMWRTHKFKLSAFLISLTFSDPGDKACTMKKIRHISRFCPEIECWDYPEKFLVDNIKLYR